MSAYLLSVARAHARLAVSKQSDAGPSGRRARFEHAGSGEIGSAPVQRYSYPEKFFLIACIFFLRARTDLVFFEKCTCFGGNERRGAL